MDTPQPNARTSSEFFKDSAEHLFAELERLDLLVSAEVAHVRKLQGEDEQFRGLYVSEQDVDALLRQPLGRPHWLLRRESRPPGLDEKLDTLRASIERRERASTERGVALRLAALRRTFELDRFDVDALLTCMAVELDLRYERLYAYLQDDVTKKKPTVDLVLNLLCASIDAKLAGRERFAPNAPLVRHGLLEITEDTAQGHSPLLARFLRVSDRVVLYLLGSDEPDARIRSYVESVTHAPALSELRVDSANRSGLEGLAMRSTSGERLFVYLHGRPGVGKQATAAATALEAGSGLLVADVEKLLRAGESAFPSNLALIGREASLRNAAVYWRGFDVLLAEAQRPALADFLASCEAGPRLTFAAGNRPWQPANPLRHVAFARVELQPPDSAERTRIWRAALGPVRHDGAIDVDGLSNKFKFTQGDIEGAVASAGSIARWRNPGSPEISAGDLYEASRLQSNQGLQSLATKVKPKYRWDDIVLPPDRVTQLREICNQLKYRDLVYGRWGFGRKLALGKGLAVLFAGPSGTGKTMAADIIAGELGLDLYKIDLARVVSKYIGETEKNLSSIFSEAETSNAILFFDEADALFGKRSEVRDSHDRYANIEIAYLLQRVEEYEGVVILATNFRKNMDEAFVRRLHAAIDFPFPDADDRHRIWSGIWPDDLPRDEKLDLELLARQLEVTGGNIRNIALAAAFLAADDGAVVRMQHVALATRREYQKMGKLVAHDTLIM
jgi:hypothetical protein